MWTTIEEMRTLGIYPDAKTYALILERPFVNENVEMIIQYVAEMMQRGITPELDTAQRAIIIATNYNLPKLALELAHAFEHDSVRRLDIEVWMNCLICAAENLYVRLRAIHRHHHCLTSFCRLTVSLKPGKK